MPMKKEVKCEPLHTVIKRGKRKIRQREQLERINVELVHAPTVEQFRDAISVFMMNTWNDEIKWDFEDADIDKCIDELFSGEILPTGMEVINLTFAIDGMDMIDTTHLIRHRLMSFSAQCHGDRDMRDDPVMIKASILNNPKFLGRYLSICQDAMDLYTDMMDSGVVNGLDARTIMPRCFKHFYFARATIKDWIGFVKMRIDEQIQTQADNIIALQVWKQIVLRYPFLKKFVDLHAQDHFYVKQCKKGKTNIFPPNKKNDVFDWAPAQFYELLGRDEYPGSEVYLRLREKLIKEIEEI